jgi:hypothetical protein
MAGEPHGHTARQHHHGGGGGSGCPGQRHNGLQWEIMGCGLPTPVATRWHIVAYLHLALRLFFFHSEQEEGGSVVGQS